MNGFSYKGKFRKGIDRKNKETKINKNLSHTLLFLFLPSPGGGESTEGKSSESCGLEKS
jgi:hypothetical protein